MSEIYNVYEISFKTLCKNIDSILNKEEFNSHTISKLRNDIQEINHIKNQMNLEINNLKLPNNKKSKEAKENLKKYKNIVYEYNNKLFLLQNKYCFNYENKNNKKDILIDDEDNNKIGFIESQYIRQQKINNIERNILDIEKIGIDIESNLEYQNELIKNMNNNAKMMNQDAEITNDLVNKVINQVRRNKIIFYILLMILVIIFIILMIIKKNKN